MRLSLNEDQSMLVQSFERLFDDLSSIERVRAVEGKGHDPQLWTALAELGTFGMRLPGDGFGLFETALAMEQAGRALATGPIVEAIISARLLATLTPDDPLVGRAVSGDAVLTLALREQSDGEADIIPGGAVADGIIFVRGDTVAIAEGGASGQAPLNHAAQALDRMVLAGGAVQTRVLAQGADAVAAWRAAVEEWKLLTASALYGLARKALDVTAEYVTERVQFDRPIGSFQGIAHPLADCVTDVEGARLMNWWALGELSRGSQEAAGAVSGAWWWAAQSARKAVMRGLHSFGGYGLTNEYDIQLYHRRAMATALILGDPSDELVEAGRRLWLDAQPPLPDAGEATVDFERSPEAKAFIEETREGLKPFDTPEYRAKAHYSFDGHDWDLNKAMGSRKLLFPTWPSEYGGRDASAEVGATMYGSWEEFEATTHAQAVTAMVGHMIIEFGQEALKQEVLPRLASGEATACLGYSEPSSGTDVFAARTKAVRDGDEWVINGQKMFTSGAEHASYVMLLTRTDPDAAKHAGITMFIVPLDTPGVEIHPVFTFQDERTNATFYSDVRLPDRYRLGKVNGGVAILGAALKLEQGGGGFVVHHRRMVEEAVAWARDRKRGGRPVIEDPRALERLARAWTRVQVSDLLCRQGLWNLTENPSDRASGPMSKLFASEAFLADSTDLFELAAPDSLIRGKYREGFVELSHRHSSATTIYGGTSEAQRSMIAEKALGLPRSR